MIYYDITEAIFSFQNLISPLVYWSKFNNATQDGAHKVDMEQCLVSILDTLPTTEPVKIIWPVNEANNLAETANLQSTMLSIVDSVTVPYNSQPIKWFGHFGKNMRSREDPQWQNGKLVKLRSVRS